MFNEVRNLINNTAVEESKIIETFNYLQNHQFVFRSLSKDRKYYALISEYFDPEFNFQVQHFFSLH